MRTLFLISTMAAAIALAQSNSGNTPSQQQASKAKKLSRAEIDQALEHPDGVLILDVRRPDEISSIGGFAVYLNIQIGELEKHLAEIPKDRPVITVSNHASRAGRAADLLAGKGFKVIGAVGVEDYEAEGGKPVKVAVPAPSATVQQQEAR